MSTVKVNLNGITELDFPSGVTSATTVSGVTTINITTNSGFNGVNEQSGSSYTLVEGDLLKLVVVDSASSFAFTVPQAGSGGNFDNTFACFISNIGAGTVTVTPTVSTIDGLTSLNLTQYQGIVLFSDGTNYFTVRGIGGGGGGSGTVTSVALTVPSWLTVSGSPITTSGTFAVTGTSEAANNFLASPDGSSGPMTPRVIVPNDLPVATSSALGVVKPDNSTITISSGIISSTGSVPSAISTGPDWPPSVPSAYDDEFTGGSLNVSLWTQVVNGVPNTIQVQQSYLGIVCAAHSGDNFTTIMQPIPTPPYTITAKIQLTGLSSDFSYAGLCFGDSFGKIVDFDFALNGPLLVVHHWNSHTSLNAEALNDALKPQEGYLRITDDGTNFLFSYSIDGTNFNQIYSESRTAFLSSPAYMGLLCGSNNGTYPCALGVDWFRVT